MTQVYSNERGVKGLEVLEGATINWSKLSQESLKGLEHGAVTNRSNFSSRKVLRKF